MQRAQGTISLYNPFFSYDSVALSESSSMSTSSLTSTLDAIEAAEVSIESQKVVTYWHAVCLFITRQIGAGIFSSPAIVNRNSGSAGGALIVWILTEFVAWAGASIAL